SSGSPKQAPMTSRRRSPLSGTLQLRERPSGDSRRRSTIAASFSTGQLGASRRCSGPLPVRTRLWRPWFAIPIRSTEAQCTTKWSDLSYLRGCAKPKLLLQGDRDQYGSRENVEALIAGMPESERRQTTLVFIPEADHFFAGKLDQVHAALAAWLHDRHPKLAPSLDETRN